MRPIALCSLAALFGCAHGPTRLPLRTVDRVDVARYMGTWYEIAAIPQSFQRGCVATTATYTLRPDGEVDVLNRCRKDTLDGPEKSAKGKAWIVDTATNARLKVSFFWPFRGDYWIIDLDHDDRFSVVGHPDRTYCWILARERHMSEETYQAILARLRDQGYDTNHLVRTLQPPN